MSALEQTESAWCPLKHLEIREDAEYPDHHRHFFKPYEIEEMKQVLSERGTVSTETPNIT